MRAVKVEIRLVDDISGITSEEKIIWGSSACYQGIDYCEQNKIPYDVIPCVWKNEDDIAASVRMLQKLKPLLIRELALELNEYHGVEYSYDMWECLLGYWIDVFLSSVVDRLRILSQLGKISKGGAVCSLLDIESYYVCADTIDFIRKVGYDNEFNLLCYSLLATETNVEEADLNIRYRQSQPLNRDTVKKKLNFKRWVYNHCQGVFSKLLGAVHEVVGINCDYLPPIFLLKLHFMTRGKIRIYNNNYFEDTCEAYRQKVDYVWRNKPLKQLLKKSEVECTIVNMAKKLIPKVYVEAFQEVDSLSSRVYSNSKIKTMVASVPFSYDELLKRYIVKIKQNGGMVADIQHGGYGFRDTLWFNTEYNMSDVFYSWGWVDNCYNRCKVIPVSIPKLLNLSFTRADELSHVLYISYSSSKYVNLLSGDVVFHAEYIRKERSFFRNLPAAVLEQMVYRHYNNQVGALIKERLLRDVPSLKDDINEDYYTSLKSCKLVILSQISTTFCEALALDIPLIVMMDTYDEDLNAKDDLQCLREVGVLCRNWEQLLESLLEAIEDVDKWWQNPDRRAVVNRFKIKYAYNPHNARDLWQKEFLSMIS